MHGIRSSIGAAIVLSGLPTLASAGSDEDIKAMRQEIEQLRQEYETRIEALENRIEAAEAKRKLQEQATLPPVSVREPVTSGNRFNPQISVILDGNYYNDDIDGRGPELLSSPDGIHAAHAGNHDDTAHEHEGPERGFNLREAEIWFSAAVDPYFDANLYLSVSPAGEVGVEEAYFRTRSLPAGLALQAGKFLSDIGYVNQQHPHQWDFVDQNLAYLNLIGDHGLQDTGVQLTWLPDWALYSLFGFEVLQGDQERLGALVDEVLVEEVLMETGADSLRLDEKQPGPRLYTGFVKFGPDLGYEHALQFGLFGAYGEQHQELHEDPEVRALQGQAWLWGTDWVYKYDSAGAYGKGDLVVQAEYLYAFKDLEVRFDALDPGAVGEKRQFSEDGFYLQGRYGIASRWQLALRYDVVGWTNKLEDDSQKLQEWDPSNRWSTALTWTPTEYSRLRFQWSRADITRDAQSENFNYFYLQFIMSLGTHGAHSF